MSDDKEMENNPESELAKAQKLAEEYLAGWQRAKADYANLKKEVERERATLINFANENLIESLLPVLENFEEAWKQLPETARTQWTDGIGFIKKQFEEVLKSAGVERFSGEGELFNPSRHEAVGKEKAPEGTAANMVFKVVRGGYALRGKIIKPAQVIIAE